MECHTSNESGGITTRPPDKEQVQIKIVGVDTLHIEKTMMKDTVLSISFRLDIFL